MTMTDAPGIDEVSPATGDGPAFTPKDELAGVPMLLTGTGTFNHKTYGDGVKINAVRDDTGEEIVFVGATVLNRQIKECAEKGLLPPIGNGVRAMLVMFEPEDKSKNNYWVFRTPEAPRIDAARTLEQERAELVKSLMASSGIEAGAVRSFVDALQPGAKVGDLSDESFTTLCEFLRQPAESEPPF